MIVIHTQGQTATMLWQCVEIQGVASIRNPDSQKETLLVTRGGRCRNIAAVKDKKKTKKNRESRQYTHYRSSGYCGPGT